MDRWLYVHRTVRTDPTLAERRLRTGLSRLLSDTDDVRRDVDGSVLAPLHDMVVGHDVAKHVRVRIGTAVTGSSGLRIPVEWQAEPLSAAFPTFSGSVELQPLSRWHGKVALLGRYRPPLGPIGAVGDVLVMRGRAERTAEHLLDRVVERLADSDSEPRPAPDTGGRLRVADVMTPDPIVLDPDMPLRTAALLLFHLDISGAPVVRDDGELVGVLSESDLMAKEAGAPGGWSDGKSWRRYEATTVGQACTRPALVTHPDASLREAVDVMQDRDVTRLLVQREAELVGIVTRHDVLHALLRSDIELQVAVDELLLGAGLGDVRATVDWGTVVVSGPVERRSAARSLVDDVVELDGVMSVDSSRLEWQIDDDPLAPVTF